MPADDEIKAAGRKWQLLGVGLFETDGSTLIGRLTARLGEHRGCKVDAGNAVSAVRQLEAQKPRAAARIEHIERAPPGQHEAENTVPGGAFRGSADTMPEILVEMRRPPSPMSRDLLFHRVGLNCGHGLPFLMALIFAIPAESGNPGPGLQRLTPVRARGRPWTPAS